MNSKKFTPEEAAARKKITYKKFYALNRVALNQHRRGEITKEEYKKLMVKSPKIEKRTMTCIDCGKEIETKTERCCSCQKKYEMIEHLKRNPIIINPGPSKILTDLWERKQVGY